MASQKNDLDLNYENLIENLLLQQVLLYTKDRSPTPRQLRPPAPTTTNSLLVRQPTQPSSESHSVLETSTDDEIDEKPTLCLIESYEDQSSRVIENILRAYNQRHSHFDHNLVELVVERNPARRHHSSCPNSIFHLRLQWLAIGLVIDRVFFYLYFTATLVSYFVTLWWIPFSHPNLVIDIHAL